MFIWDYILTFGMEVDLVWKSKWNVMKGLYLLQRYAPFIDTLGLVLYRQFSSFLIFVCSFFLRSNGGNFDRNYMLETILRVWRFVDPSSHQQKIEGTHFVSSIHGCWARCIRKQVQPYTPSSGVTDWRLPVILTLRTWSVWNRNKRLSIVLLILYNLSWASVLVIFVRFMNSVTCTSDLDFVSDFHG